MDTNKQKLLSLYYLIRNAGITQNYKNPQSIKEIIVLSDAGKLLLEEMKKRLPEETENSLYYGFLLDLYHKEFWVDTEQTDVGALVELFDQLFFTRGLQIPWMFGRDLYDNFYRLFAEKKEFLEIDETADLLEGTPCGVAQVGTLVVGPFGLIDGARTARPLFPSLTVPLWHCADIGCEQLHYVDLELNPIPERHVADEINDAAIELLGDGTDWHEKFRKLFPYRSEYYDNQSVNDLPALLISCLSSVELKTLCSTLLIEHSSFIRGKIKQRGASIALLKNSSSVIASKLTRDQCLQIMLLLADKEVIDTLEKLIHQKAIYIPPAEVRSARLGGQGPAGWLGMYSEISQFGFRRMSGTFPNITLAITRLRKLIVEFYSERKIPDANLMHLLRFNNGATAQQRLDDYINNSDPRHVIRELISIHDGGLIQCISALKFGFAPVLTCQQDEHAFIDKILWKLGFEVPAHANELRAFESRLDALLFSSRGIANASESEREKTRSAAVNLFVSLEELLDRALSYSSWLFLSDHFARTRFQFRLNDGRAISAKYLSGKKIGGGNKLELRKDGKNTLFPLIEGLNVLAEHISAMRKKSSKKFLRKIADVPGYAGKSSLETFPFSHTLFLYDVNIEDVSVCSKTLTEASSLLRDGMICDVRNRLEHKREDFPSRDEIEKCCDAIASAVRVLISYGLCPVDYYRVEAKTDQYGRIIHIYRNYSGHEISINYFPTHLLSYNPPGDGPIAITPSIHIGDSSDLFYADIVNISEFVEMWKDYPKRPEEPLRARSIESEINSNAT